jgi:hypothetical protein
MRRACTKKIEAHEELTVGVHHGGFVKYYSKLKMDIHARGAEKRRDEPRKNHS